MIPYTDFCRLLIDVSECKDIDSYIAEVGGSVPLDNVDDVIQLLTKWGIQVSQRKLSIDELFAASESGALQEVFSSGTAAVISPIGWLNYQGKDYNVADNQVGPIAQKLYDTLYGIQTGTVEDDMGWTVKL